MTAAVHAAGGPVAAHVTTGAVGRPVPAGSTRASTAPDSESDSAHGPGVVAWTPTLCAVLTVPRTAPGAARRRAAAYRERLRDLLPAAHRLGVTVLAGPRPPAPSSARSCCWPSTG